MSTVWHIFSQQLTMINWGFSGRIHSFVLMNNHFHLLLTTPKSNLDEIMAYFMRETTRSLNAETGRINQAFGGPYFRCIVGTSRYYLHAYKYIYANPVKSQLVTKCENYPFSSLNFLVGQSRATFPVEYDDTLFSDLDGTLNWLNREVSEDAWTYVKNAMGKKYFKLARLNSCRNDNPLEWQLL